MNPACSTRRTFLHQSAGLAAGALIPYFFSSQAGSAEARPLGLRAGCIGNGNMGRGDASAVSKYADIVALCDVDRNQAEILAAKKTLVGKGVPRPTIYEDYRKLLDRKDIDVVTISTPDHWHSRIAIHAMQAGKDVYCQKPLTLTIDEGKQIIKALEQTKRVFQVGTQQRSSSDLFLTAVAMVQAGRIGKVRRVTCVIGSGAQGGQFTKTMPPAELNWDLWLGQTPKEEYIPQRCHRTFRWWYEYSGGKLTDWGAHHVDIAQWAIGMDHSGPLTVEPVSATFASQLRNGMPTVDDRYNTAVDFNIRCRFSNGVEMIISDDLLPEQKDDGSRQENTKDNKKENGILFEGEKGRFFVNRGRIVGKPAEALKDDPIPPETLVKLRKGKEADSHMGNFIRCVQDRSMPVSDVYTHHRAMTTCHLANIAIRLGRKITWDPQAEQIVGDREAQSFQSRPQRKGFEVEA
jgi:predicted dehydrogenase